MPISSFRAAFCLPIRRPCARYPLKNRRTCDDLLTSHTGKIGEPVNRRLYRVLMDSGSADAMISSLGGKALVNIALVSAFRKTEQHPTITSR
jgi:hypothetical protein